MNIVNFQPEHVEQAKMIAIENYETERSNNPALPLDIEFPDLNNLARNGLGVAAIENDQLIGYLCCCCPHDHAFDTIAKGVFSEIHAHGAIGSDTTHLYQRMYQEAAQRWIDQKVTYHGIALYTHDQQAIHAFFDYGFGHRCADAIRKMEPIPDIPATSFTYEELKSNQNIEIRPLRKLLSDHMGQSPCFMYSSDKEFEEWLIRKEQEEERHFVAKDNDKIIAFLDIAEHAETFIADHPKMKNIVGAYCLPQYRGQHIYQNLINFTINQLHNDGSTLLGVDYESFNPTANRFWQKYFSPYTTSVVRRIDEGILQK